MESLRAATSPTPTVNYKNKWCRFVRRSFPEIEDMPLMVPITDSCESRLGHRGIIDGGLFRCLSFSGGFGFRRLRDVLSMDRNGNRKQTENAAACKKEWALFSHLEISLIRFPGLTYELTCNQLVSLH